MYDTKSTFRSRPSAVEGCPTSAISYAKMRLLSQPINRSSVFSILLQNPIINTSSWSVANSSSKWASLSRCRARLWPQICTRLPRGLTQCPKKRSTYSLAWECTNKCILHCEQLFFEWVPVDCWAEWISALEQEGKWNFLLILLEHLQSYVIQAQYCNEAGTATAVWSVRGYTGLFCWTLWRNPTKMKAGPE